MTTPPIEITEAVDIWTWEPRRIIDTGVLCIADDGLPYLRVGEGIFPNSYTYRPWTLPVNWLLKPLPGCTADMLLGAWEQINGIRDELAAWRGERIKEMEENDAGCADS